MNTTANLLSGGVATYTITATIAANATGTLTNTATVTVPSGVTDGTPGNNAATDTTDLTPQADLVITKTDHQTTATPGTATTYTIVVTNNGPSIVTRAAVTDTLSATLTGATWACVASSGSSCGAASGSGNLNTTVNLLSGGTATYTVIATIAPDAQGTLSNTPIRLLSPIVEPVR